MKTANRIISFLLAMSLCLGVAGCGGKKEDKKEDKKDKVSSVQAESEDEGDVLKPDETLTESETETESSAQSETSTPAVPDKPDKPSETSKQEKLFGNLKGTVVKIPGNIKISPWEKDFNKRFEKKYGCKVEVVPMSFQEQQTKLPAMCASGDKKNYLDVCTISKVVIMRYVYGNIVQPIDKYLDVSDPNWRYYGTSRLATDLYKIDGKNYGSVNREVNENYILYNKTYMQERGIPDLYTQYYKKGNWDFETFIDVAKKCVKKGKDGKSIETYGFATWNYLVFCEAAGNSIIKNTGRGKWDISITDPAGMAGLDLLYKCAKNDAIAPFSGYAEFPKRKVAMLVDRPGYALSGTDAYHTMSDKIGLVPLPKMKKGAPDYVSIGADGYGVATCAKNVPGAVAYIYEVSKDVERRDANEGIEARRKRISDEHLKIRNEYMKNAIPVFSLADGLANWYTGKCNRQQFLDIIIKDKNNPATAIDKMLPLLKESLRATVG